VDGTTVVDIKPYVPTYDVSEGLATKREVQIAEEAQQELRLLLEENEQALEFYGGAQESPEDCFENVLKCICETATINPNRRCRLAKQSNAKRANTVPPRATLLDKLVANLATATPVLSVSGYHESCHHVPALPQCRQLRDRSLSRCQHGLRPARQRP
jgi:hypothetical protein